MTITNLSPGDAISGSWVSALQNLANGFFSNDSKACTAALSLTTSLQDITGCSKTFSVVGAHSIALCFATFDNASTVGTGNNVGVGSLVVDGSLQTGEAHWDDRTSRTTAYQSWTVSLAAGSHTIKLQAKTGGGTQQLQTIHTKLTVIVFDLP